jgi:regulator of replication initiation timing
MSNQVTFSTISIVLLIVGLVVGAGGVYFTTSTPMQSKISDLEEQVASLNSDISALSADVTSLVLENSDLETQISELANQIDDLETLNDNLESQVSTLENEKVNLENEIDYLSRQEWDHVWNQTLLAHMLPGDPVYLSLTSQQLGTKPLWANPSEIKPTYLQVNRYYELNFMAISAAGGDLLGYLVAMHHNGYGFIVNFSSQEHVSYLFESIDTPEEALELIQLAYHRSGYSAYVREFMEITSNDMYLSVVDELNATCVRRDEEFKVLSLPPVNYTRVSSVEGGFSVERVFLKESGLQRLVYMKALVYNDGSIVEVENYVFIEGAFGYLL